MAKVSEVVAILKKQSDLIGKLRSENADLLAALNRVTQKYETIYCDCVLREFPQSQPFDERPEVIEARAAIEKAS